MFQTSLATLHKLRPRARRGRNGRGLLFCLALIVPLMAGLPAAPAWGATNGSWSVFPSLAPGQTTIRPYFQPVLTPGVTYKDSVTIANQSSTNQVFNLYGADAFNTANGAFSLRRQIDPKLDMGAWVHLPVSSFDLPARREVVVPFTIDPPANAAPGDHDGGIVAESRIGSVARDGSLDVKVLQAVGVRIYGRVRGRLAPRLTVSSLSVHVDRTLGKELGGSVAGTVQLTVTDTGNTNLNSKAHLSLSPLLGQGPKLSQPVLPQLLPHGSATLVVPFSHVTSYAHLSAHLTVSAPGADASATSGTPVIPWALLALLLALAAFLWWRGRRHRPPAAADGIHPSPKHAARKAHAVRT